MAEQSQLLLLKIELDKLNDKIIDSLKKFNFIKDIEPDYEKNILKIKTTDEDNRAKISGCIFENNTMIIGMSMERATLEEVFVEITRGGVKNE